MIKLQSITLPDGFLREEIRDGYTVSSKMKEVWAVELDLLQCFINVCEKYSLRYFMDGGTLLGAVRHQGFIPWDNDIDVSMPLDDYLKLHEIAKSEFHEPYHFMSEYDYAQAGVGELISRLYNVETTAVSRRNSDLKSSSSIWIDIFPLIGLPPALERDQYIHEIFKLLRKMQLIRRKQRSGMSVDVRVELSAQLVQFKKLEARYPITPATRKISRVTGTVGSDRLIYNYWDYQDTVPLPFEMLTPAAPRGYKNILRTFYGVWKKPIQQYCHGEIIFDTDRLSVNIG